MSTTSHIHSSLSGPPVLCLSASCSFCLEVKPFLKCWRLSIISQQLSAQGLAEENPQATTGMLSQFTQLPRDRNDRTCAFRFSWFGARQFFAELARLFSRATRGRERFSWQGLPSLHPSWLVEALLGSAIGAALATLLKFDRREIEDGIHGFNPTLVGVAVLFFLDPGQILVWILLIVGCLAATIVCYLMRRFLKFPSYTAPFVVSTWILFLTAHWPTGLSIDHPARTAPTDFTPHTFIGKVSAGEAEVMFGANCADRVPVCGRCCDQQLATRRHSVPWFVGGNAGSDLSQ